MKLLLILYIYRAVFPVGGELQRRLQDRRVEHRDGGGGGGDAPLPYAAVPLHADRGALRHHHRRHARPRRLRGRHPPLPRRQVRLRSLHGRLHRRRLRQHPNRPRPRSK